MPRKQPSKRALVYWGKLIEWYGSRVAENYGDSPPEEWCEFFDRNDPDDVTQAMRSCRHSTPIHPPTLGQLEAAVPEKIVGPSGPSKAQKLCDLMLEKHDKEMCKHQRAKPWNYFGPSVTFDLIQRGLKASEKPPTVTHTDPIGVQVPGCEECGTQSFRVRLDQALVAA